MRGGFCFHLSVSNLSVRAVLTKGTFESKINPAEEEIDRKIDDRKMGEKRLASERPGMASSVVEHFHDQ